MSRYIDADKILHYTDDLQRYCGEGAEIGLQNIIEMCPTADVAPVIRCKDCKHCYYADNRIPSQRVYVCGYFGIDIGDEIPDLNFYCGKGETEVTE